MKKFHMNSIVHFCIFKLSLKCFNNLLMLVVVVMLSIASVSAQESVYQRQMNIAVKKNDLNLAKQMLKEGAKIPLINEHGFIHLSPELMKFIIDNGYEIADSGKLYTAAFTLNKGIKSKLNDLLNMGISPVGYDAKEQTVFHRVMNSYFFNRDKSKAEYWAGLETFVKAAQTDINRASLVREFGFKAAYCRPFDLAYGKQRGYDREVAKLLMDAGTDPNICSCHNNFSPLMSAVLYGDKDMVSFLLRRQDVNVNFACRGRTALNVIRSKNSSDQEFIDIELMLMKRGAEALQN